MVATNNSPVRDNFYTLVRLRPVVMPTCAGGDDSSDAQSDATRQLTSAKRAA